MWDMLRIDEAGLEVSSFLDMSNVVKRSRDMRVLAGVLSFFSSKPSTRDSSSRAGMFIGCCAQCIFDH